MIFTELALPGAFLIELEPHRDERGLFARSYCAREFADHGLIAEYVQNSISFNNRRGVLRGLHYQAAPHAEDKLVRCTRGAIYDVLVDLRPDSPTLRRWAAVELTADNHRTVYLPKGFAHGFETLTDGAEVLYQMSAPYEPQAARGVRWNDPAFGIDWPIAVPTLSERDRTYADWQP